MLAVLTLTVSSHTCPSDHYSAVFVATIDQAIDNPNLIDLPDPGFYYFYNVLKVRYQDILHITEDAIYFLTPPLVLIFLHQCQLTNMNSYSGM